MSSAPCLPSMIRHDGIGQIDPHLGCSFASPYGLPKQHAPPSSRLLQLTLRVHFVSKTSSHSWRLTVRSRRNVIAGDLMVRTQPRVDRWSCAERRRFSERAIARRSVFQKMIPMAVGKTADRSWLAKLGRRLVIRLNSADAMRQLKPQSPVQFLCGDNWFRRNRPLDLQYDIERRRFRRNFRSGRRILKRNDEKIRLRCGLKPSIPCVLRLSSKIHLGYQSIGAKVDKKMDMRRAYITLRGPIGAGLYGSKCVAPLLIRLQHGETFEIGV